MTCRPILYTYEADTHCTECALERFGNDGLGHVPEGAEDSEGNEPGVLARWDTWELNPGEYAEVTTCGTCGSFLCLSCGDTQSAEEALPDRCWNCRANWRDDERIWEDAKTAAEKEGKEAGENAAEWWQQDAIGGRTSSRTDTVDVARKTLQGIEDIDPEIMDSLPFLDLSGQWADGPTEEDILRDILAEANTPEAWDYALEPEGKDDLIEIYRQACDSAVMDSIETMCREHIAAAEENEEG